VKNAAATMRGFNKDRFVTMTSIANWKLVGEPGGPEKLAAQLDEDVRNGAVGLKVWKNFGLTEKDAEGKRIPVDDPRLAPVWRVAAKHKIPVLIHTADPKPLFEAMDKNNERWLELKMRPNRAHPDVSWDEVMAEQHRLFARHRDTIFINAHMGWLANDLGKLGQLLDRCPNVYIEIGAIYSELGRQPRNAKAFFTKYQDRVLFGKDSWNPAEYPFVFRLLETADEYIEPLRKYHGLWKLYGLELPDPVLKKLYYKNALRIVPGLSKTGFPD
jgi:predicted TIM-barrel fold metal-dependent hydrolase